MALMLLITLGRTVWKRTRLRRSQQGAESARQTMHYSGFGFIHEHNPL
jgi:hypothetical protein